MTARVPLSRGLVALVDDADLAAVLALGPWHAASCGGKDYARRWCRDAEGKARTPYMHTVLTGWSLVDHANGDGLDNRRANLRPATSSQNAANKDAHRTNTSGYKGVGFYRRTGRWRAYVGTGARQVHLGYFDTAEAAARAYDAAAAEHFGEFARFNFPDQELSA